MPRPFARTAPWLASLALHAAAAALAWALISGDRPRPGFLSVGLLGGPMTPPGGERAGTGPARGPSQPAAEAPPIVIPRPPGEVVGPRPPDDDALRTAPGHRATSQDGGTSPSLRFRGSPVAEYWSTRSLALYVDALRRGEALPDSVLDLPRTEEEVALERTTRTLNEFTDRLQWAWTVDRFRRLYAENFPAMR